MNKSNSKQKLGLWMLTALVTGNMIGSGVFYCHFSRFLWQHRNCCLAFYTAAGAILLALVFANLSLIISTYWRSLRILFAQDSVILLDFKSLTITGLQLWVGNAAIVVAFVRISRRILACITTQRQLIIFDQNRDCLATHSRQHFWCT